MSLPSLAPADVRLPKFERLANLRQVWGTGKVGLPSAVHGIGVALRRRRFRPIWNG
jgi:hypothetical protein